MSATAPSKASKPRARANALAADALLLLEADHRAVVADFEAFGRLTDAAEQKALADRICEALTVHAILEEEIFYPAARDVFGSASVFDEALVEHEGAKILVAQIRAMSPAFPLFAAKVAVLSEQVSHHIREEEAEIFPRVRESKLELKTIGGRLAARKAELLAQLDRQA